MRHLLASLLFLAVTGRADEIRVDVKYRTASNVYLAGGSAEGLAVGDRLSVSSRGSLVAELEVVYLAEHSASCSILRESRPVQSGDVAVISKHAAPEVTVLDVPKAAAPAPPLTPATNASSSIVPWARARGAFSLGWNRLWDDTAAGFDFEQRTARLDVGLWDVAGRPIQVNLRARGRQDIRTRPPGSSFESIPTDERRDRLYELSARYDPPGGRVAVEVGRLGVPMLGLGSLDGGVVEFRPYRAFRLGGFFGNRADVENVGFVSGLKYGGYLRLSSAGSYWPGGYDLVAYGVREEASGDPSREYLGVQGRLAAKRFTFLQWAEVDLLRGWRTEPDGSGSQLSNLSLSASYRMKATASATVSYDQRRNYRTAENRSIPEILFDQFLHHGFRSAVDFQRGSGLGGAAFVGLRLKQGTSSADAWSYGAGVRHLNLFGTRVSGGLDASGFSNGTTSGTQGGVRLGHTGRAWTADLAYGLSRYTFTAGGANRHNQWLRASGRFDWRRGLWLYGDVQYDDGDDTKGPRAALEVGYRF